MPANVVAYWCGLVKLLVCGAHPDVCVCHIIPGNLISTCQRHVWAVPPNKAPDCVNLTIRQSVAALARRTWSTAQATPQLLLHLEWWRAYYHFVRPHASLRVTLALPSERGGRRQPRRYRQRTPAMAAGLAQRRWTVRDLLTRPVAVAPGGYR